MSAHLAAVDPGNVGGLGSCAVAFFVKRELVRLADLTFEEARTDSGAHIVALEVPMIYPQGHERPNDLIQLGIAGALVAAALSPTLIVKYTPAQWKGQKAKPACHLILWEKFSANERALFPKGTEMRIMRGVDVNAPRMYKQPLKNYSFKAHNLLDAAAIGLFHLGR